MTSTPDLGAKLRTEFPIFAHNVRSNAGGSQPFVYLDTAATAQKPRAVIEAMKNFMERDYGSVHRGAYGVSIRSSQLYEAARARVAKFVGPHVSPQQVVFTRGTTESLNILAHGLAQTRLTEDCRIVVPAIEHHANFVPWQQAALQKNSEIAYIPLVGQEGQNLRLDLAQAEKIITKNTRVVALAHVGNVLGQINPVAEITELAKKVGALVVLDCAQSIATMEANPLDWGVDALVFSAHKLYGPTGIGVLVASEKLLQEIPPLMYGGGMISNVTLEGSEWATTVAKFEAGTPPVVEAVGFTAALDWLESLGRARIHAHEAKLAQAFVSELKGVPGIQLFAPQTGQETIVSFRHEALHAHDLATILDADNVAMRAGHHCAWPLVRILGVDALLRASFSATSDFDDVEIAVSAIKRASRLL